MTDHIGEATEKVIDLDALEKWANEWPHWKWTDAQNDALKALIAELREARGLLSESLTPGSFEGESKINARICAFLARNGKGEGG
jgi:hypothetical protein